MTATNAPTRDQTPPDQRQLNKIQAKRLAALAGVSAKELEGQTIAQLGERLKWQIDPIYFLFRQICGKVVKKDPVTGVEYPVPFATVYVEDTDCNFISYFPRPWPWGWHFPLFCHREVIGTTTTDACGNFCVWVPRFDIDWILRWRLERVCYPIIFNRPTIGDLLPQLPTPVAGPWPPGPDPGPLKNLTTLSPSMVEAIAGSAAGKLAQKVARLKATQSLGSANQLKAGLLNARAFESELPPPLPAEFHRALSGHGVVAAKGASAHEGIRSAVALKLGLDPAAKEIASFNPRRFIGPFFRCYDIVVPEWQIIFDVPDITFRVTQDVNGNGTPVTIYSEGYFDVRWDAGPLPDVTLVASSNAIALSSGCNRPPSRSCPNGPEIQFAGGTDFMELIDNTIFNGSFTPSAVTSPAGPITPLVNSDIGYALGPNRGLSATPAPTVLTTQTPAPTGCPQPPAQPLREASGAPFYGTLSLSGCVDVLGAQYYRIMQSTDQGATFSPVLVSPWPNIDTQNNNTPLMIASDPNGWFAVNPVDQMNNVVPRSHLLLPDLILMWQTPQLAQSLLYIEIADGSKNPINTPKPKMVAIQTDNKFPDVAFNEILWKVSGADDNTLQPLPLLTCPLVQRAQGQAIEIVVKVTVSSKHLRNACLYATGCGGGSLDIINDPNNNPSYWYNVGVGNTVILYQRYYLAADALPGCYTFWCFAGSRALNPDSNPGGNTSTPPWFYDPCYIYADPSINVAIVGP
jgi:hypothetical protein